MTTSDDGLDRLVDEVREVYNSPGDTPREEMWSAIARRLETDGADVIDLGARRTRRSWLTTRHKTWAAAAAAVLVMGIGIGRITVAVAPQDSMAEVARPVTSTRGLEYAAAEHLGRTESMLTMVRSDARDGNLDAATGEWARLLLAQTRLLLDARGSGEDQMKELLEDVELVLVQLVGAADGGFAGAARSRTELDLALRGLEERKVLPRLQAAGPQFGLSGS